MAISKIHLAMILGGALLAALLIFLLWPKKVVSFRDFALCLSEKKIVMYGSDTCANCLNQKKIFGDSFPSIHYINCDFHKEECAQKGITVYPVWMNGEKILLGIQSFPDLGKFSGCLLPSIIEEKSKN